MRTAPSREDRTWPAYLFGGRLRTSTLALIVAFVAIWWLCETYEPPAEPPPQVPATEVVPPGFVPDPAYTWAPRTNFQQPTTTTTTTATTPATTTTTSPSVEETPPPATSGEPTSPTTTPVPPPSAPATLTPAPGPPPPASPPGA